MDNISIFRRLFNKLNREEVENLLRERGLLPAKYKNKRELEQSFLALSRLIKESELTAFVERAVLVKTKGLPAFTHKLTNTSNLLNKSLDQLKGILEKKNHACGEIYSVSTHLAKFENNVLYLKFVVKVFEESWKSGQKNLDSISAIHNCDVKINLSSKVVTIFCGDDEIHGVIEGFIGGVLRLSIQTYRIKDSSSTLTWADTASYKTALFLDFIYNRLKGRQINSSFKELKFKVSNDDIKDVTINGKNIINTPLACEYVSLGKDIIHFKTAIGYEKLNLSCSFSLKGRSSDILKIVILDTKDDSVRLELIEIIQQEYINMCEKGIKDLDAVQTQLRQIYTKFAEKDSHYVDVLKENVVDSIKSVTDILPYLSSTNVELKKIIENYTEKNKVLLETLNYNEINSLIRKLSTWSKS